MSNLYVLVGPDFSGQSEFINKFTVISQSNLQIIDETAVAQAQRIENISRDPNYRYQVMAVMARSHLSRDRDVIANCNNLSVEALVLWKKMASEYGAVCIIVLFWGDAETSMSKVDNLDLDDKVKHDIRVEINEQFKRYDDLRVILTSKFNTIKRDLADMVVKPAGLIRSQEDNNEIP